MLDRKQATPISRRSSRWDQSGGATPIAGGITPGGIGGDTPKLGSKWDDETPRAGSFGVGDTPAGRKKSRWDQVQTASSLEQFSAGSKSYPVLALGYATFLHYIVLLW